MNLPSMHMTASTIDKRTRGNQWDTLAIKIDDIVLNRDFPLDVSEILKMIQASLLKRQEFTEERSNEFKNTELDIRLLDQLIMNIDCNHERDGLIEREERLLNIQVAISKVKVPK